LNVKILNPDAVSKLFTNWGETSAICYDTHTDDPTPIGKGCMANGHFSGSRGDFIKFLVTDIPRFTVDQAVRHEVGVFKNVQSFRYVGKDHFAYEVPVEITDNPELLAKYDKHMQDVTNLYEDIQSYVLSKGKTQERANEQARYVLPISTHTAFVIGFSVEALIHFMHKRLCSRAEDIIRQLAVEMKKEVIKILPNLESRLVPECQYLLFCPENKKSCGAYPKREEIKLLVEQYKKNENK
jgi:thymidylate synthase (FAD)